VDNGGDSGKRRPTKGRMIERNAKLEVRLFETMSRLSAYE
jgi:hypothetical protein